MTILMKRLEALLEEIYGPSAAPELAAKILNLLLAPGTQPGASDPHRSTASNVIRQLALTERDVVLITYGDQVRIRSEAPLQTLAAFCETHLRDLVSAIHLLPHYPYTSDDGFAVTDYRAVNPELGTWEDVARLSRSFDLMLDAVFNHLSAASNWFRRFLAGDEAFADFFVTVEGSPDLSLVVRPRALPLLTDFASPAGVRRVWTTFSADQVDLNVRNPAVLLALIEVTLFYVACGARFLRLDAIAYLWKEIGTSCIHRPQAHAFIQLLRAVLDLAAPQVLLITETNVPHYENISYFGDGTNEAQLVYNFALPPLLLHALLKRDATYLAGWARSLTVPAPGVTFFNFTASHDGIGLNPARGILPDPEIEFLVERCLAHGGLVSYKHNADGSTSPYELNEVYFDALSDPQIVEPDDTAIRRFLVSQAVMLALRGMPGIYFHSLVGSRNDAEAARTSGIARRINRRRFERSTLEAELANPDNARGRVLQGYRRLLQARRSTTAFSPRAGQTVLDLPPQLFGLLRVHPETGDAAIALHNVTEKRLTCSLAPAAELSCHRWQSLFTNQTVTVGSDVELAPYEALWLRSLRC